MVRTPGEQGVTHTASTYINQQEHETNHQMATSSRNAFHAPEASSSTPVDLLTKVGRSASRLLNHETFHTYCTLYLQKQM